MNDRDVATLYIAEMRALLPVLRTHLATLGARLPSPHRTVASQEIGRLAMAAADLSADFRADDCSALAATLARAFPPDQEGHSNPSILASAADALTYMGNRIERMDAARRVLAPTESDRAAVTRLLTALASVSGQSVSGALSSLMPLDADAALPQGSIPLPNPPDVERTRVDPPRPLPPPVTSWLPQRDDIPGWPARPPLDPQLAPTTQLERRGAHEPFRPPQPPHGDHRPQEDTALTRPALPITTNKLPDLDLPLQAEPARVELSDQDLAILHAFRTQPLRLSTHPLATRSAREADPARDAAQADLDEIRPEWQSVFVFETTQDLKDMQESLIAFEQYPQDRARLAALVRTSHKIKGAAGTLNYPFMAELAHAFEDQLGMLRSQQVPADERTMSLLAQGLGELERALAGIARGEPEDADCATRMGTITGALLALSTETSGQQLPGDPAFHVERSLTPTPLPRDIPAPAPAIANPVAPVKGDQPGSNVLSSYVTSPEAPLRVDVRRLDDLMNRVSSLAMNRAEITQVRQVAIETETDMERAITRLAQLGAQLSELRPHADGTPSSRSETASAQAGFMARLLGGERRGQTRPLPESVVTRAHQPTPRNLDLEQFTEYDHLMRALDEAVSDVATSATAVRSTLHRLERLDQTQETLTASIQDNVNQMRLVPLSTSLPRLLHAVRVLAAQFGKSVTISARGEMTEIDRDVSEALAEALMQLLRNAVVHGIESPEERDILGKPTEGAIWLHAYYTGNEVNIEVGDDGRGINPDKVLASARVLGIIGPEEARLMDPQDALKLIFEQGVSGADMLTTAAGRGVGMADVAESIARVRGTIEVRSQPGEGTAFHIRVPISLSIVRAMHVRVGAQEYAIPFAAVLQTLPLPPVASALAADQTASERRTIAFRVGEREIHVPLYPLAQLLGVPGQHSTQQFALIVELGRQYAAFGVDGIVTDREIVVRALPAHLRRRAVRGAAVTPTGGVLLVLDLPQLANRLSNTGDLSLQRTPPVPRLIPAPQPLILVVDDSLSIRQALVNALSGAGFAVQAAHDGMEALEMLLETLPALVVLDIEMPRLDGYELLGVMRSHVELARVPVIMLTSRGAQPHRHYAESLGADAYLVKPCPDDDLVATIRRLLDQPR